MPKGSAPPINELDYCMASDHGRVTLQYIRTLKVQVVRATPTSGVVDVPNSIEVMQLRLL